MSAMPRQEGDTGNNHAVSVARGGPQSPLLGIVVNHTHWDREWYMPFQRYRVLLIDAVDRLLDILATQADYGSFLLDGQTAVVEDYLEVRPEQRPLIARHVRNGRIALGPWYVLPDEFLPTGESLIRNLLLGRSQMAALGATPARVGYLPDTFGHPSQLPQILSGFDLESAVLFRGVQSDASEFLWQAPDGTRILTIYLPGGYFNAMELARAPAFWLAERMEKTLEQVCRFATTGVVLLMNGCDHFEPQPATQAILDETNRRQAAVHLQQGTLEEYVELVRPSVPHLAVREGEWRYNRPARITPGVLSARMYLKQADHRAAILLERGAEPLLALAAAVGAASDANLLATAWRYLLQNHPHDSICGCSVDAVHRDGEARFRWASEIAGDLVDRGAARLARKIATPGPGFAVFNTLATPRAEVIHQRLHFLEAGIDFTLQDAHGRPIVHQEIARRPTKIQWDPQREHFHLEGRIQPAMVVSLPDATAASGRWQRWFGEEVEILFPADLPAGGYTTVQVAPAQKAPSRVEPPPAALESQPLSHLQAPSAAGQPARANQDPFLAAGPNWLENSRVRVQVATDGSCLLWDKETGLQYGPLHVFRSEGDRGDEYSFCPAAEDQPVFSRDTQARIAVIEDGPLRATLEIHISLEVPAGLAIDRNRRVVETRTIPIRTRLSLVPGRRRLELRTELENTARDHRLRVLFATGVQTDVADSQGQFTIDRRPIGLAEAERKRVPEFDEEQEVSYHPQRAFVDVADGQRGMAVLNRGLPEYEAEKGPDGVVLALTLLRAVGWLSRDDLATRYKHAGPPLETPDAQCPGPHVFEYAVLPHKGDWLAAQVPEEAEAFVTPVWSAALTPGAAGATWPATWGFYKLEPTALVFSACKRSEDGKRLVLRAYNTAGHALDATLHLGMPARVCRANLAEREQGPERPCGTAVTTFPFRVRPHEIVTFTIEPEETMRC